jgi:drug/metabolite transporter (DMT)-like permease
VFIGLFSLTCTFFLLAYLPGHPYTANDELFHDNWYWIALAGVLTLVLTMLVFYLANPKRPNRGQRITKRRIKLINKALEEQEAREQHEELLKKHPGYRG